MVGVQYARLFPPGLWHIAFSTPALTLAISFKRIANLQTKILGANVCLTPLWLRAKKFFFLPCLSLEGETENLALSLETFQPEHLLLTCCYFKLWLIKKKWRLRQGSSGILPKLPWRSFYMKGWEAKLLISIFFNILYWFVMFCKVL